VGFNAKTLFISNVSYFNLGGIGALFGWLSDGTGNMTDTSNYRPVVDLTLVSKQLEHFILSSISPFLRITINLFFRLDMVLTNAHFC